MKKSVVLTLCILLSLALTLGGTIAYLTDTDGDVNVMTLGRVEIALEEYQRGQAQLEKYENDRMLHPQVGEDGNPDQYGLPTNPTFHDKIVRVTSDSSNANAFLRVWIGVPSALLDVVDGQDAVHLVEGRGVMVTGGNIKPTNVDGWPWRKGREVQTTIEDVPYTMFCYEYTQLLKPGDVTPPVLAGLYLDSHVDNDDSGAYTFSYNGQEYPLNVDFSSGLQIPVLAQAVQADGFGDVSQAANAFAAAKMDDPALFDEYLDLNVNPITEAVQALLDAIARTINGAGGDQPYDVPLRTSTYLINASAAAELNKIAATADTVTTPEGDSWQKSVQLIVEQDESVQVILRDGELAENIVIVNEGGELVITGN